jgi:hypothetical protein
VSVLTSIDALIAQAQATGFVRRLLIGKVASTTNATTSSGSATIQRYPNPLVMPSAYGSGVTGAILTHAKMAESAAQTGPVILGVEYSLGDLAMSTNTFTDGVVMPSKTIRGTSVQTATIFPLLMAATALTATTPVITITYKNQAGAGSKTATLTLPTNAALDSCFSIAPHLAAGDTGIQDITGLSKSAGTAGTLRVLGVLILAVLPVGLSGPAMMPSPLAAPFPNYPIEAGATIAMYRVGSKVASTAIAALGFIGDN